MNKLRLLLFLGLSFVTVFCIAGSVVSKLSSEDLEEFGLTVKENFEGNFQISIPYQVEKCTIIAIETMLLADGMLVLHSELANTSEAIELYSSYIIFDPLSNYDLHVGARYKCASMPTKYYDFGSFKTIMSIVE